MVKTQDLGDVYGARSPEEIGAIYDGWSESYDADNLRKGFRLPGLAAGYVARHVPKEAGPVLDAGCGTGLVGEALWALGYRSIRGIDISEGMLNSAARLTMYEKLDLRDLSKPLPEEDGSVAATVCTGSFGPGHAPASALAELARVTRPGGAVVFNLVEGAWEDRGFPEAMEALSRAGRWEEVERSAPVRAYLLAEPDLLVRLFVFRVL